MNEQRVSALYQCINDTYVMIDSFFTDYIKQGKVQIYEYSQILRLARTMLNVYYLTTFDVNKADEYQTALYAVYDVLLIVSIQADSLIAMSEISKIVAQIDSYKFDD